MKQIVKTAKFLNTIIAKTFGIEIKRISILPQIKDDVFQSILDKVKDYTFLREEGLHSLFRQMKFIEQSNRKGCIVECGVWKGGVASLLAGTNLQYSREMRTIHLFDAFDDICAPSKIDGERANQEADKFLPYKSEGHKIVPLKGFYDEHGGHGTIEECMDLMIKDLTNNILKNLRYNKIKTFKDINSTSFLMVDFSDKFKNFENEIRFFLKTKMYNNKKVLDKNNKGKLIIKKLFFKILRNPKKFISKDQLSINKYRAISDFISGMTDRYAINLYNNIK